MINIPSKTPVQNLNVSVVLESYIMSAAVYRTGHGIDSIIWYRQGYDMKEK